MQSQSPSTKTQSLDRVKYRHEALQKIKNDLSHHEIQASQSGLPQNNNSSQFDYQIPNGKQQLSRLSKPYNGIRHETATDYPQNLLNFTQSQQAQPQQQINGQKVLASMPQYQIKPQAYMRCSPALDSGAGSSRSDSPHSHSQLLVNSRQTSTGQYSPSPSNFSDGPPVPPPRNSAPAGTPTPPPPSHYFRRTQNTTPTTQMPKVTPQTTRGTSPVSGQTMVQSTPPAMTAHRQTPVIPPNGTNAQQQISQQIKAISLYQSGGNSGEPPPPYPINTGGPPLPPSYTSSIQNRQSPTQSDFRKSPSSGIYSATSAGSPSPITVTNSSAIVKPQPWISGAYQTKTQPPIIMQSVKSTQVQKPVLQTAIAPQTPANISPSPVHQHLPPHYSPSPPQTTSPQTPPSTPPIITNSINGGGNGAPPIKPTTEPPSYAKTIQVLKQQQQQQQQQQTTRQLPPPPPYNATQAPESSLPATKQRSATTTLPSATATTSAGATTNGQPPQNGEQGGTSNNCKKIKHQSPIPERKQVSKEKEEERKEFRIRHYSPQAFKFYMEQHIENVLKSVKQRAFRKSQLEKEMMKINLAPQAQVEMRKMLNQKESNYIRLKRAKMDKSMFVQIKAIGLGAFGEVSLVRKIDTTNHLYAMKTLRKADVLKRNQVAHVKAERDILAEADNEWVVKLYYSFQDRDNLYFVMDYIPGGDLMSLLIKKGIFEEPLAIFYIAELTCAVESVHKMGFIHRDIKPDNILIDRDGHIKLTDFGLCTGFRWTHNSKYYQEIGDHARQDSMEPWEDFGEKKPTVLERRRMRDHQRVLAHSLVGTPNYIAPEVLQRSGYTQLCDWWSVGVILYEMLVGQPPFLAETPLETQQKVINWEKTLHIPPLPKLTPEATDLIRRLCSSQDKRLGKNADEVKAHEFFKGVDFADMRKQKAPFIPKIEHPTDTSNFDPIDPDKLRASTDSNSEFNDTIPFHGFLEFTFRRFFDDRSQVPEIPDDPPGPVYV